MISGLVCRAMEYSLDEVEKVINGINIVVPIKQVPDMEQVKFDAEKGTVDRSSAAAEINPFDLNALEAAIQVKDKLGGTVTTISMGPPQAESALGMP